MKAGTEIQEIFFKDSIASVNLIDVLFQTNEGLFLFSGFHMAKVQNANWDEWTRFEKLERIIPEKKIVSTIKLENDLSLIVQLQSNWYVMIYFLQSNMFWPLSEHILDIFNIDELSKEFLNDFDGLDDLVVNN